MKPLVTEKAIMKIELENVISFTTSKNKTKDELKKEIEDLFKVKVESLRTSIRGNKKYVHVKLKKEFPAIDVATKLGMI